MTISYQGRPHEYSCGMKIFPLIDRWID